MRFFYSVLLFSTLLSTTYCSKSHHEPNAAAPELRITPDIRTRATDMDFENQDAIGVTVRKKDGSNHLINQRFIYDGNTFSASDVYWYPETEETSTLIAYYPYSENGQPNSFTVKTDQRGTGYTLSDLLGATKSNVKPTAESVALTFYHLLSKIDIQTTVPEGVTIEKIEIGGFIPTVDANIESQTAAVNPSASATSIIAHEIAANKTYDIILPPQTVAQMRINIKTSGKTIEKSFSNVTLLKGKRYTLQLKISETETLIHAAFSGAIENWGSGSVIGGDTDGSNGSVTEPETPSGGEAGSGLIYGGVTYKTSVINGLEWMAENLRYKPENATEHTDYRYPNNEESQAATLGILYTYKAAMAGAGPVLNDAATVRGICPEGWRLPKIGELVELTKITGRAFFSDSGYFYDKEQDIYSTDRSYVMSSTQESGDYVQYLRISNVGEKIIDTFSLPTQNIFASIRCVKDTKE